MSHHNTIKTYTASGAITRRRIVKFGASDKLAVQASAIADLMFGISTELDAIDGQRVDVVTGGECDVEFGGTVARGTLVTADASGKAIALAPGAGLQGRAIGQAMVSAVAGDIGLVQIQKSIVTTPA